MTFLQTLNLETIVLLMGIIFFIHILYKWHTDPSVRFDVKDLLMVNGKMSLSKTGQFICMLASTWVLIYQTRTGALTEWVFSGYMLAWAGVGVASKLIDKKLSPKDDEASK